MDNRRNPDRFVNPNDYPTSYALSGKIMLTAIVILFAVVVVMICLHLYARWYLLRARRRNLLLRNNRRRTHLVFYAVDPAAVPATRGLDASVLKSLPVFEYSSLTSNTKEELLECAVCLSDFEEGEKGRTLPKCNHSFHIECIDTWFQSHSTCPNCRSPVDPVSEVAVKVHDDEPVQQTGSSSCATCKHGEEGTTTSTTTATSSFRARRKEMIGVSEIEIEIPRRNESFGRSENESPMSHRSPGKRIRSLKRILSRSGMSSPSEVVVDLERGKEESLSQRSRVQTPR